METRHVPPRDALGHTADLAHRATFPLLGIPVEVRSNSASVLAAAERAFGGWRDLAPGLIAQVPPAIVSVVVQPVDAALTAGGPRPFVHRVHGRCFVASDGANLLTAQYDQGRALAFIAPELLQREAQLRYNVLQLLALLLATQHDRVPLHAGAVVIDGLAILLAGKSTAGKSTLCYAAVRDRFQLLAEDVVYVSRAPDLRLWGLPERIHLVPDAVRFFPELIGAEPEIQANGKLKIGIETASIGPGRAVRHAERAVVCLVERHAGAGTRLEPVDPEWAAAVLSEDREPGFDLYEGTRAAADAVAAGGAYRLTVGHDFGQATAALRGIAGNVRNGSVREPASLSD
jgi:hypothetical protein